MTVTTITLAEIAAFGGIIVTISGAAAFILNGLKKLIKAEMVKMEGWTRRQQSDIETMKQITESLINSIRIVLRAVEHSEYGLEAHNELEKLEKTVVGLSVKGKSAMEP